jgi:hypothetical protein
MAGPYRCVAISDAARSSEKKPKFNATLLLEKGNPNIRRSAGEDSQVAHRIAGSFLIMATLFGVPAAFAQTVPPQQPLMQLAGAQPQGEAVAKFRAACGQDFRRFCTGVQPGGGRVVQCLLARRGELSAPCRSLFAEMRAQPAAQKNTPSNNRPQKTRPTDTPPATPADMPQAAPPPTALPGEQDGAPEWGALFTETVQVQTAISQHFKQVRELDG